MINITDKHLCCGCSACVQSCPKHCITMQMDSEGFLYPHVNEAMCIDCGQCEVACSFLHPYEERTPQRVYAANNDDTTIRMQSSSGGLFTYLAKEVLLQGGVVFGARFNEEWQVVLDYIEDIDDLVAFRGSKYIQARVGDVYTVAEEFLKQGRKVLFSGTPCQVAGLHHYLHKSYDNLLTVDIICHGAPSPKVWKMYLKEVILATNRAIRDVKFRDKPSGGGWRDLYFTIYYDGERENCTISTAAWKNHYMRAFLSNMILRPSCHDCKAKCLRSHSDITIGDFWGVQHCHPALDDDKGTSIVLVNSPKGRINLQGLITEQATYGEALRYNPSIVSSVKPHPHRTLFFNQLDSTDSITRLIDKQLKPTPIQRLYRQPHRCKAMIKAVLKKFMGGGKSQEINMTVAPTADVRLTPAQINFRDKTKSWKVYNLSITFNVHNRTFQKITHNT